MVGVPESHFSYWAAQFVAQGYKVAKASQSENQVSKEMRQKTQTTTQSKKEDIIRRELTCVLTGGTLVDENMLHDEMATYCIAVKELCPSEDSDPEFGVAFVDAATGEMGICQFKDDRDRTKLETLLAQLRPKEVLLEKGRLTKLSTRMVKNSIPTGALWNSLSPDKEFWDEDRTESELLIANYFSSNEKGEISSWPKALQKTRESSSLALSAYGALVFYLRYLKIDTEIVSMGNVHVYDPLKKAGRMILDGKTLINLEIFENSWDKGTEGTVFRLLWRGVTPFGMSSLHHTDITGKRLFRLWLCHPLRSARDINTRLDATDMLTSLPQIRDHFLATFNRLPDLERILSRVHAGRCKVKDFVRVLEGFQAIQEGVEQIKQMQEETGGGLLGKLLHSFGELKSLLEGWEHAFDWEKAKEEGVSVHNEVDF
jgi:DNA mismatch repair protein MSH6